MNREDMLQLLDEKANRSGLELPDTVKESIYEIIGGIPGFALSAIKCAEELGCMSEDVFIKEKWKKPTIFRFPSD